MASIDPSLLSNPKEQKWVDETSKILNHQLETSKKWVDETDIKIPSVSVFQVPETMTTKNPETYEPQQIGLGPIHHFQPRTYKKMEQKKLDVMRKVLKDNDIKDYKLTILNNVKKVVPIVRSCYDMFLEHDDEHLTWVFAIDGLFLLNIFYNYNQHELTEVGLKERLVAQDVLMDDVKRLENVIKGDLPADEVVRLFTGMTGSIPDMKATEKTELQKTIDDINNPSLLSDTNEPKWAVEISKMLNHQLETDIETPPVSLFHAPETMTTKNPETYEPQHIGLGPIHHFQPRPYKKMEQKKLEVMRKVLQDNDIKDYELTNTYPGVATSSVPIVRSCYDMLLEYDDEHLTWVFAIDGLFLLNLFQNYNQPKRPKVGPKKRLVAQDVLMVENQIPFLVLKEIDESLCSSSGDLRADEVVKLFTGMSGSIPDMKTTEKTELQGTIDKINMAYNSRWKMKPYLSLKKLVLWLLVALKAIGGFVGSTWKIVAYVVGIVTVFTLQAYCDVYGCDKTVTLLPFELLF
ncbi:hypothetical protein E3N88_41257 [Mikania micrantha]|uniref:Uncharacterized protein n=1 Tax=Mikania micrantha TaxID=192012 RepID=A0A5N6LPW7_9ASTR|nr:hypothetical protein E3N88_41257 [Mikania micrantha]